MKSLYQNWKLASELPMNIYQSANLTFYPHLHTEIEFIYVESGALLIGVNEDKRLLRQGDMVICSSNDIHYFDSREHDSKVTIIIFKPDWINMSKSWPNSNEFRFASPFISGADTRFKPVKPLLDRMLKEKAEGEPGYRMFMKAGVLELCGTMLRYLELREMDSDFREKFESRRARMQQILSFIQDHYEEDLNVSVISQRFQMEPSHFSRTFKSSIGMNFKAYLNTIRVLTAEHKLLTSDLSITEIAFESGFSSIRTFNRVFKELRGCIPSSLRESL